MFGQVNYILLIIYYIFIRDLFLSAIVYFTTLSLFRMYNLSWYNSDLLALTSTNASCPETKLMHADMSVYYDTYVVHLTVIQ